MSRFALFAERHSRFLWQVTDCAFRPGSFSSLLNALAGRLFCRLVAIVSLRGSEKRKCDYLKLSVWRYPTATHSLRRHLKNMGQNLSDILLSIFMPSERIYAQARASGLVVLRKFVQSVILGEKQRREGGASDVHLIANFSDPS
jgi:hypothetical protein